MAYLAEYHESVIDANGNAVAGAIITVRNSTTNVLASLYSDRGGSTAISNPVTCDSNGRFQFYVTDGAYNLTYAGGAITSFTRTNIELRSVQQHAETTPIDHPDGSVTASKLAPGLAVLSSDNITVHEAKTTGIHGVGANYIASSSTATPNAPTFQSVTITGSFLPASLYSQIMVATTDDLQTAVDNAVAGSVLWLAPGAHAVTNLSVTKELYFIGNGAWLNIASGGTGVTIGTSVNKVRFYGLRFYNSSATQTMVSIGAAGNIFFSHCYFDTSGGYGVNIDNAAAFNIVFEDCIFKDIAYAAIRTGNVDVSKGRVSVTNCIFQNCNYSAPATYGSIRFTNPASGYTGGHKVYGCVFDQTGQSNTVIIEAPNCYIAACHHYVPAGGTYLSVAASATNTWAPNNTQYTGGAAASTFDPAGNIVASSGSSAWDYISAIIAFTPATAAGTPEAEEIGTGFNHNLGTKNLQAEMLCSDTSDFSGYVWPVALNAGPWGGGHNDAVEIIYTNNNTARVFVRCHNVDAGASHILSNAVQQRIDPTSPSTLYDPQLDWTGTGGNYYTATYWRLALRRIQ